MRKIVAFENLMLHPHDVVINPGSLFMPAERIPICWNFDVRRIDGWASDLQVENGEISMELEITDKDVKPLFEAGDIEPNIYVTNTVTEKHGKHKHLKSGNLRAIGLTITRPSGEWILPKEDNGPAETTPD